MNTRSTSNGGAKICRKAQGGGDEPSESYYVWFSAEGECELLPGDKSRVVNTRPVKEEEEKK